MSVEGVWGENPDTSNTCQSRSEAMKTKPPAAERLLRPEVVAVIRSAFDGYNEPEPRRTPAKKTPAKPPAARAV
jgi:hypothetical protein